MDAQRYEYAIGKLDEIGTELGSWIGQQRHPFMRESPAMESLRSRTNFMQKLSESEPGVTALVEKEAPGFSHGMRGLASHSRVMFLAISAVALLLGCDSAPAPAYDASAYVPWAFTEEEKAQTAQKYLALKQEIEERRPLLGKMYRDADASHKPEVIGKAREFVLDKLIRDVFPLWMGTKWAFYGNTQMPKHGEVACGVFVATTLRDVGFNLNSGKYAEQPSEYIIKNLAQPENIKRYSNAPIDEIRQDISGQGHGLYIVGLDCHVGFILNNEGQLSFIHSSYYIPPCGVTEEPIDRKNPLADSKYRVTGKIFDDKMMVKWLEHTSFPLRHNYFFNKRKK